MKIYFAAPLFTTGERMMNAAIVYHLRLYGHTVFLPQELEQVATKADAIFKDEVTAMNDAEAVVVCADGPDPDSGTSWELGNTWRTKLTVAFRTDIRDVDDGFPPFNLMLTQSVNAVINCKWKSCDQIAEAIDGELRRLYASGALPKGA